MIDLIIESEERRNGLRDFSVCKLYVRKMGEMISAKKLMLSGFLIDVKTVEFFGLISGHQGSGRQ